MEALKQEISRLGLPKELKVTSKNKIPQSGGGISKILRSGERVVKWWSLDLYTLFTLNTLHTLNK